jgi:membrane protein implicated in regulation of membrane protease activity
VPHSLPGLAGPYTREEIIAMEWVVRSIGVVMVAVSFYGMLTAKAIQPGAWLWWVAIGALQIGGFFLSSFRLKNWTVNIVGFIAIVIIPWLALRMRGIPM